MVLHSYCDIQSFNYEVLTTVHVLRNNRPIFSMCVYKNIKSLYTLQLKKA